MAPTCKALGFLPAGLIKALTIHNFFGYWAFEQARVSFFGGQERASMIPTGW